MQDALLSKLMSTKKHNFGKLSVLYGNTLDTNIEDFHSSVADQLGSMKLLDHCFLSLAGNFYEVHLIFF